MRRHIIMIFLITGVVMQSSAQIQQSSITVCEGDSAELTATNPCTRPCQGATTVTDTDGNIYPIIEIGGKCWMAENLRVSAGIPEVADSAQWVNSFQSSGTPAWCYYNNDPANGALYGKLYNGAAILSGVLCPQGWHIPADWDEWCIVLLGAVGGPNFFGALKSTTGWLPPNYGATNSSCFSALPGGARGWGNFYGKGEKAYFGTRWTTGGGPIGQFILPSDNTFNCHVYSGTGVSCRCVKDY